MLRAQRDPAHHRAKVQSVAARRETGLCQRGRTWWARFSVSGTQDRQSLETPVKKEALKRLAKLRTEIAEGRWWRRSGRSS